MTFTKEEKIGISVSILVAVLFFGALRFNDIVAWFHTSPMAEQAQTDTVNLTGTDNTQKAMEALSKAVSSEGKVQSLVIKDSKEGSGATVAPGSRVTVNYIGTLENGTKFDDSYSKGQPFSFIVGRGEVIQGWDKGLIGMKVGGQRILVIPPDMAYGNKAIGTIPANSTLLFAIELIKVE